MAGLEILEQSFNKAGIGNLPPDLNIQISDMRNNSSHMATTLQHNSADNTKQNNSCSFPNQDFQTLNHDHMTFGGDHVTLHEPDIPDDVVQMAWLLK